MNENEVQNIVDSIQYRKYKILFDNFEEIEFVIDGKPHPKGRPRFRKVKNYVTTYTDKKTRDYETMVGRMYLEQVGKKMEGAIHAEVMFLFEPPKSLSKKKKKELYGQPYTKKPDIDNLLKALFDGLNDIAFDDDAQIVSLYSTKLYCNENETNKIVVKLNKIKGVI